MNRSAPLLLSVLLPVATPTLADVIGAKLGANYWGQSYDARARKNGEIIDLDSTFDIDTESDWQLYAAVEHPIPLLPNIQIQHTRSTTSGDGVLFGTIFDGIVFEGEVDGELDLTHTDATVYWELLDGPVSLDLGMSIRFFDAGVELINEAGRRGDLEIDDIVPMLYVAGNTSIPGLDLTIRVDGNYISFDGDKVFDIKGGVAWEPLPLLGVELGYRYMDLDYQVGGGLLEATAQGPYLGMYLDF